jgi:putative restriction endonuclease
VGSRLPIETYIELFSKLRQNADAEYFPRETKGRAPHKPLLLLAVLDLFTMGGIVDGRVPVSPELGELFSTYWSRVLPSAYRQNLALPFFHLQNDGAFWRLVAIPGNASVPKQISSVSRLRELIAYAELDPALVACLSVKKERARLREVLIRQYFTRDIQADLLEQAEINTQAYEYSNLLLDLRIVAEPQAIGEYIPAARNQGFRRAIVTAYDYRCAMCGIRVLTADGHAVVDAAHIHAWSESRNDNPTNGLSLCRLCHWSFDEGLLGADMERTILVSPQLSAQSNVPGHLAQLARRPLIGPGDTRLAPDPAALWWHRSNVFRAS